MISGKEDKGLGVEGKMDDPVQTALEAGLRYVSDAFPGLRRQRRDDGFVYLGTDGPEITDDAEIQRIKKIGIPPAWTDVWICPSPLGHIQATGRDARKRKQYRYHPTWREFRDENKFDRMLDFGQALPRVRHRVMSDLRKQGLPREKVLATVVRLMDLTSIRIGNEAYARRNDSYGLTTMTGDHVDVNGTKVEFRFKGKSGKFHQISIRDRQLARIIERMTDLPGEELFQYLNGDAKPRSISSDDVNAYLREVSGHDFTAKEFRTWAGTVLAVRELQELGQFETERQAARQVVAAIKAVAKELGNTVAICKKCYIHPAVVQGYLDGTLFTAWEVGVAEAVAATAESDDRDAEGLPAEEAAVLSLLRRQAQLAA
jgi:DNA topoisomerase-1